MVIGKLITYFLKWVERWVENTIPPQTKTQFVAKKQKPSVFWFVPLANALVVFGYQGSHSTLLVLLKNRISEIG